MREFVTSDSEESGRPRQEVMAFDIVSNSTTQKVSLLTKESGALWGDGEGRRFGKVISGAGELARKKLEQRRYMPSAGQGLTIGNKQQSTNSPPRKKVASVKDVHAEKEQKLALLQQSGQTSLHAFISTSRQSQSLLPPQPQQIEKTQLDEGRSYTGIIYTDAKDKSKYVLLSSSP